MRGLICDDHPLMRQALAARLRAHFPGAELVEVDSFPKAWEAAVDAPDFCIVDLAMPGAEPREGVVRLQAIAPDTALLVLTGLSEPGLLRDIEAIGVAAIIPKTLEPVEMLAAIEAALPPQPPVAGGLPPRQHQVLSLLAQGLTNKEIALRLSIAPATVKIHVSRLIEQLGAVNRTDAVSRAQRAGLL